MVGNNGERTSQLMRNVSWGPMKRFPGRILFSICLSGSDTEYFIKSLIFKSLEFLKKILVKQCPLHFLNVRSCLYVQPNFNNYGFENFVYTHRPTIDYMYWMRTEREPHNQTCFIIHLINSPYNFSTRNCLQTSDRAQFRFQSTEWRIIKHLKNTMLTLDASKCHRDYSPDGLYSLSVHENEDDSSGVIVNRDKEHLK